MKVPVLMLLLGSLRALSAYRSLFKVNSQLPPSRLFVQTKATTTSAVDYQKLIREVIEIISNTGIRTGVKRTIQAVVSVDKLIVDIFQNPSKYQDQNRQLSLPKILKELFIKLGATYVKLGQFIASSPTLFPADYVLEFQSCLDKGPTVSYSEIRQIIESDLKKPISSVFQSVDPVPLASASIAQVHKAILRNGTEVVIKVRKPYVEESLKADLGFLYVSSKLLELVNPDLSRLSISAIIGDLRASMLDELDFTKEAKNLVEFREFLSVSGITEATAPMPYPNLTSKRVLVMEYLKGVPLVDLDGIKRFTDNPEATLITALRTWALSVANSDFYHADVHAVSFLQGFLCQCNFLRAISWSWRMVGWRS